MEICIYRGGKQKEFVELVRGLKCIATKEQLFDYGFTNFYKPYLYLHKQVDREYDISFILTLCSDTLEVKEVMILDEDFGQPYLVTEEVYEESKKIIDDLLNKKLFVKI